MASGEDNQAGGGLSGAGASLGADRFRRRSGPGLIGDQAPKPALGPTTKAQLLHLAMSPLADENTWFRIVTTGDKDLQLAVAQNPEMVPSVLELVARTGAQAAQIAVAQHPKLNVTLLVLLSKSPSVDVVEAVARHPMTPPALLEQLARSPHEAVRAMALRHPKLDPSTMQEAVEGPAYDREAVAANPNLPRAQVARLAANTSPRMAMRLLRHPKLDGPIFDTLLAQADEGTLAAAVGHRLMDGARLEALAATEKLPYQVKEAVLRSPRVTSKVLAHLAGDPSPAIRMLVARHPLAPDAARVRLLRDGDEGVKVALMAQAGIPMAVVEAVVEGPEVPLKLALLARPKLPDAILLRLMAHQDIAIHTAILRRPRIGLRVLQALAESPFVAVRFELAQNPSVPRPIAEQLSGDENWAIREAAFRGGNLGPAARARLSRDPVPYVRQTVTGKGPFWPWEHARRDAAFHAALRQDGRAPRPRREAPPARAAEDVEGDAA